jgi:uncharacterized protein YcbK (DUF882 family)
VYIDLMFIQMRRPNVLGILGKFSIRAIYRASIFTILTSLAVVSITGPAMAARDRTLYLYYTHTKETAKITFKRNGRYDSRGLAELNQFLRDWRRNEPTKMDPRLFDLVWEVYQEVGATKPIHVVSAYRSPKTNEMLRSRSSGVAKNSNHTRGLALDFFIPGVPVSKLRAAAMKLQKGGVGYYPTSGSPFVHLDTGSVRAWPRMTTAQLKKIFPDGKTLHIPSNGVVLSKAGYAQAKAEYKKCKQVPCNSGTRVASASSSSGSGRTLMDVLFGRDNDKVEAAKSPTQRTVKSAPIRVAALGQLPPARPNAVLPAAVEETPLLAEGALLEVTPPIKPRAIQLATAPQAETATESDVPSRFAVASIGPDTVPNPSRFANDVSAQLAAMPNAPKERSGTKEAATQLLAAYAPSSVPESPDAQKALEIILNRQGETQLPQQRPAAEAPQKPQAPSNLKDALTTASLNADFADFTSILSTAKPGNTKSTLIKPNFAIAQRAGELVEPDLEHIVEFMTEQARFETSQYAVMFEPDEADLAPTAIMGSKSQFGFSSEPQSFQLSEIAFKPKSAL